MAAYVLAVFTGAFLLFQVQPLIAKYILPWFGGGPGVWTACLLFFQIVLLGGYAYAHVLTQYLPPRKQVLAHLVLLVGAVLLLPITPSDSWKPTGGENPVLAILALLAYSVGLPYFVLSSTAPLLQRWIAGLGAQTPYRLYALSNAGSLVALLSFPFYFEPHFTRQQQMMFWSIGFVLYGLFCAVCAVRYFIKVPQGRKAGEETEGSAGFPAAVSRVSNPLADRNSGFPAIAGWKPAIQPLGKLRCEIVAGPSGGQRLFWFLLPFCASLLLLAVTNKICQDVAVVPFLWVLPLAVYLLSFIVAFDSPRWYGRVPYALALIAAFAGMTWALFQGTDVSIKKLVAVYSAGLFVCCTVCHAEAYRLRPAPSHLTSFYLAIAAGGALGGVFVALIAPFLFKGAYELHWALLLCAVLFLLLCARDWTSPPEINPFRIEHETGPDSPLALDSVAPPVRPWRGWMFLGSILPLAAFGGFDFLLKNSLGEQSGLSERGVDVLRIGVWSLLLVAAAIWFARGKHRNFKGWRLITCLWLGLGVMVLGTVLWTHAMEPEPDLVYRSRNFYGTLSVYEYQRDDPLSHRLLLQHGGITHGIQFLDRDQSGWATTYYGEGSGLAKAIEVLPRHARRIGVVGLGTGTIAAHAQPGDYIRFYEINPKIHKLATERFSYLAQCRGQVEVVLGDARLSMERDLPQEFDLLALDAFSSDAIPAHLLTREAFALYDRHLRADAIIAVHISNHYLDLEPVVDNLARELGYQLARIEYDEEEEWWQYGSLWILLSRSQAILESPVIQEAASPMKIETRVPLWTDDFTSVYQILK